jgi:ABC-type transport system involved in cytochrome c biogenesis permease subunit
VENPETPFSRAPSLHRFANPGRFLRLSGRVLPWLTAAALVSLAIGLGWGLFYAPPDWQQGETVRILYIHVPMAWLPWAAMPDWRLVPSSHWSGDTPWPMWRAGNSRRWEPP